MGQCALCYQQQKSSLQDPPLSTTHSAQPPSLPFVAEAPQNLSPIALPLGLISPLPGAAPPSHPLLSPQVLLLSARDALLSRLILNNRSDPANTQRFCRVAFGAYNPRARNAPAGSATPSNSLAGAGGRSLDELRAAAGGLLEGSGVPELEERVLGYLCEAAGGVKLVALLDDTDRLLTEVRVETGGVGAAYNGTYDQTSQRVLANVC